MVPIALAVALLCFVLVGETRPRPAKPNVASEILRLEHELDVGAHWKATCDICTPPPSMRDARLDLIQRAIAPAAYRPGSTTMTVSPICHSCPGGPHEGMCREVRILDARDYVPKPLYREVQTPDGVEVIRSWGSVDAT